MLKRVRDLSPANFLKLLFAFFSVAFLVAAMIMARPELHVLRPVANPVSAVEGVHQLLCGGRLRGYVPEYGTGVPDLHRPVLPARQQWQTMCPRWPSS